LTCYGRNVPKQPGFRLFTTLKYPDWHYRDFADKNQVENWGLTDSATIINSAGGSAANAQLKVAVLATQAENPNQQRPTNRQQSSTCSGQHAQSQNLGPQKQDDCAQQQSTAQHQAIALAGAVL